MTRKEFGKKCWKDFKNPMMKWLSLGVTAVKKTGRVTLSHLLSGYKRGSSVRNPSCFKYFSSGSGYFGS